MQSDKYNRILYMTGSLIGMFIGIAFPKYLHIKSTSFAAYSSLFFGYFGLMSVVFLQNIWNEIIK